MPGYSKVPDHIRGAIAACATDNFYVGVVKAYSHAEIAAGVLEHLGISLDQGKVIAPVAAIPEPTRGRWSGWNAKGRVIVRKDLPKVTKTWGWDVPIYGDSSKGMVSISHSREIWQRQTLFGQQLPLLIAVEPVDEGSVRVGFRVDRVFDRQALDELELRMGLSLVRENVGTPGVVPSDLTVQEWLEDQTVSWEILPIGERGTAAVVGDMMRRMRIPAGSPREGIIRERVEAIAALNPPAGIVGDGEFSRYFGFKFRDDLVVLENMNYGNAIYLMYDNWQALSQRSRVDLLADPDANFDRIVHRDGWERRLRAQVTLKGHDPSPS